MESYASIFSTEQKSGLSVNSGTIAVVDPNLKMVLNKFGLYEPQRIDSTIEHSPYDTLLSLVSAMSDQSPNESLIAQENFSSINKIQYHPVLGYYLSLLAGYVQEEDYREKGSSGGLTTWLLVQLLRNGYIDGVIHFKETNDRSDVLFKYAISRAEEEIRQGSKSRYYPGEVSETIRAVQASGGRYAITGIPSFITEIQLLKRINSQLAAAIPYTFGLICGHQKSTKYAEAMAWENGIRPGDLLSIDFRKKNPLAPASEYLTEIRGLIDGEPTTIVKAQSDLFVANWGHGFFKPRFSDFTDDAFNETADIALGDAWLPQYVSDSDGTNVLIVRHPEIEEIINDGFEKGLLHIESLSAETVLQSQLGLVRHTRDEIGYRLHRAETRGEWVPRKRFRASNDLPLLRKRVQVIREEVAIQSHKSYYEAAERGDWDLFFRTMNPYISRYDRLYFLLKMSQKSPIDMVKALVRRLTRA